jgi:hypothetical protein
MFIHFAEYDDHPLEAAQLFRQAFCPLSKSGKPCLIHPHSLMCLRVALLFPFLGALLHCHGLFVFFPFLSLPFPTIPPENVKSCGSHHAGQLVAAQQMKVLRRALLVVPPSPAMKGPSNRLNRGAIRPVNLWPSLISGPASHSQQPLTSFTLTPN